MAKQKYSTLSYKDMSVVDIDRLYDSGKNGTVVLTGNSLTIPEIISISRNGSKLAFSKDPKVLKRIKDCYLTMIQNVKDGVPIYGCNTGYGARASRVLVNGNQKERLEIARMVSEGIAHVDMSVGPVFEKEITKGAMLIRINMLMQGVSAVRIEDLDLYRRTINANIIPIVHKYGGIGASGDLAHNCRVLSALRQLNGVKVWNGEGKIVDAKTALSKAGIKPLILEPKAGLGLVNGDNFSTSLAANLVTDTLQAFLLSNICGAMMVEVLKGTDRSFHPLIANVRPHSGQGEVASLYRYLLNGSKLAYQEMTGHKKREPGVKVQDGYSLRGISQYHGVNAQKLKEIMDVITINANSVSDNPLWVPPDQVTKGEDPWQWVSGANFIAMYMVEAMDGLRKIMTQIVKLNDRHLARLVSPNENNGLPANLSDPLAITQCTFKGAQIQSGMFEVYSQLLSVPVSTFFGVHEEGNQDITSHALTSGILAQENLRLVRYSIAQNLLAVCQAVDLRGGAQKLSPKTRPIYEFIRKQCSFIKIERPLNNDIETVYESIVDGSLMNLARKKVLAGYET